MPKLTLLDPLKRLAPWGAATLALALPHAALASLGDQEASVASDAVAVHATIKMQQRTGYRVHEINMISGTVLREYVASNGTVFAVAWRGPTLPNLNATLGQYFDTYMATARLKQHSHRAVIVNQDDLVINSVGHMRSFTGVAYLPKSLPAGVSAGDLQ